MRALSDAFTLAQKSGHKDAANKAVFTKSGSVLTYTNSRIVKLEHTEMPFYGGQTATITLDNSDKHFESGMLLNLKGASCVISRGIGANYSAYAPLTVVGQDFSSSPGRLRVYIRAIGIMNLMAQEQAELDYDNPTSNTDTLKDIIIKIAQGSVAGGYACFNNYTPYTVDWDSEDAIIDTSIPADSFRVRMGETRLAKINELLEDTRCAMIPKADGHLHIFVPTIKGAARQASTTYVLNDYVQPNVLVNNNFTYRCTTAGTTGVAEPEWPLVDGQTVADGTVVWTAKAHDYVYNNTPLSTNHTFFWKSKSSGLVVPNYVKITSPDGVYSGDATHADHALVPVEHYEKIDVGSDAEASAMAEAKLAQAELSRGNFVAPINCGQEVYDWIKLVDRIEVDTDPPMGNVAYIKTTWDSEARSPQDRWSMEIILGGINIGGILGAEASTAEDATKLQIQGIYDWIADAHLIQKYHNRLLNDPIAIIFIIDGGGVAITTGVKGFIPIPFACTILEWELLADLAGAIVVDVWKDKYVNFPPTDADAMPGAGKEPTIVATNQKAQDTDVTDWTSNTIEAGKIIAFNVDSCTTITRCTLVLRVRRI